MVSFVYHCARKGFVGTVVGFAGYAVALFGARQLSGPASVYAYDNFAHSYIAGQIETRLLELGLDQQLLDFQGIGQLMGSMPKWMTFAFSSAGLNPDALDIPQSGDVAEQLADMIFKAPVLAVINSLFFFIFFSVLVYFVRRASGALRGVNRLPLVGTVNCALGGLIGVLEWAIFAYIAALLLKLVIEFTGGSLAWLNYGVFRDTYIIRIFFDFTPIINS